MKRLLWIIFTIICFLIIDNDVHAIVNKTNAEIECIYANGIVIGMSYDKAAGKNTAYVKEYPIVKTSIIQNDSVHNVSFYDTDAAISELSKFTCPSTVSYWIAWEKNENLTIDSWGEPVDSDINVSYRGVYSFGNQKEITKKLSQRWWQFWFSDGNYSYGISNITGTNIGGGGDYATIPLVGERFYLVDDIKEDGYGHTYKTVINDEQAVGQSVYAQIYNGYGTEGSMYLLQVGGTITTISASVANAQNLCIIPSITLQDSNRGEIEFKISSVRHSVKIATNGKCNTGQLFVRTTETCKATVSEMKDSFCDDFSNTAFLLADIIKIIQILIPILMIILTCIDLGKIVIAGNIEEELPKRKKVILIRKSEI